MPNEKLIITHSGNFHADEIIACILLKTLNPDTKILRTRDLVLITKLISKNKILAVVDVYGVYDHNEKLYDHHQRGFNEVYGEYNTKLSSAGLIYKHYGRNFIKHFIPTIKEEDYKVVLDKIYEDYFQGVDATDNGVSQEGFVHYRTLDDIVKTFYDKGNEEKAFLKAYEFIKHDLYNYMKKMALWYENYKKAYEFIKLNSNEEIIILKDIEFTEKDIPWIEMNLKCNIKFLIKGNENEWKAYAVPVRANCFKAKVLFKEEWRGLRNEELQKVVGRKSVRFVHSSGFLAVAETMEDVLYMCKSSLQSF